MDYTPPPLTAAPPLIPRADESEEYANPLGQAADTYHPAAMPPAPPQLSIERTALALLAAIAAIAAWRWRARIVAGVARHAISVAAIGSAIILWSATVGGETMPADAWEMLARGRWSAFAGGLLIVAAAWAKFAGDKTPK